MDQNVYEVLVIFDSNRFARDRDALPKSMEKLISSEGGEVLISRLWDERKLAYPIKGQRKGTYWLIYFRGKPGQIKTFNRHCEIDDNVLRQLVLKVHPHLVDAILAHAGEDTLHPEDAPAGDAPATGARAGDAKTDGAKAADVKVDGAKAGADETKADKVAEVATTK